MSRKGMDYGAGGDSMNGPSRIVQRRLLEARQICPDSFWGMV